ncbi:MAG TPA: RNA methyltransferase [Rhabdochlamydiaceae bacterium]|nr:RNA methyltransferase [Rhabdochlamydiaceae bacterium]
MISSLQHPLVKRLVKLRDHKAFRAQEKSVLIVGVTLVSDVAARMPLKTLISVDPLPFNAKESYLAPPNVLEKIISISSHDLVAAEVEIPKQSSLEKCKTVVVLDAVSDPGNVGTVLRTAIALGWDGAFLTPRTADPFNDKALRAARGAPLFLPLRQGSHADLKQLIHTNAMNVYVADVEGKTLNDVPFKKPLALVLGHETEGPSDEMKALGQVVSIPMANQMESLNVASAAAIFMYQIGSS